MEKKELTIGQYGNYTSFIEDKVDKTFLVKLVGIGKYELRFQIDSGGDHHLTVSRKCFPIYEWNSGTHEDPIRRKTVIEML